MSGPISSLFVELKLQADSFLNDMKSAQKEAKELEKEIRPAKDAIAEMGAAMTAAGGLIIGTFAAAVKSTADFGDHLNDTSKKLGISTEELSKLNLAAETNGLTFDDMSTGLTHLAKSMELANAGGKEQIAAFKAAGISAEDLKNAHGDVNLVLKKLADSFANSTDGAGKTAVAMQLAGKNGAAMIPFLNEGSDGLKRWGDEAERSGRVISQQAAAAADNFNDSLTVLQSSLKGAAGTIGADLIPPLTDLVKDTTEVVRSFRDWASAHPDLIKAIGALGVALTGAGGVLVGLTAVLTILPELKVAFALMTSPVGLTVAAFAALAAGIIYFRNEVATVLVAALDTIVQNFENVIGMATKVADAIGPKSLSAALHSALDSTVSFRKGLDDLVVQGEANFMTVEKTQKAIQAEELARRAAGETVKKHNDMLLENTGELEKNRKAAEELAAFWKKQEQEFKNQTFAGGEAVKEGLAVLQKLKSDIIAADKDLMKLEAQAGDDLIKRTTDWDKALEEFKNTSNAHILEQVKEGEAVTDAAAKKIIKLYDEHKKAAQQVSQAWSAAMGQITTDFAKGITDMIFEGKRLGDSLESIAKNTAKNMMNAFLAGVFNPLTEELGKLGKGLGDTLTSFLGMTKKAAIKPEDFVGPIKNWTDSGAAAGGQFSNGFFQGLGSLGPIGDLGIIGGAIGLGTMIGNWFKNLFKSEAEKWQEFATKWASEESQAIAWSEREFGYTGVSSGIVLTSGVSGVSPTRITRAYAEGTDYVPSTGPAILHQGEAVIPANDNAEIRSLLSQILVAIRQGGDVVLDGDKVGRSLAPKLYRLTMDDGMTVSGTR